MRLEEPLLEQIEVPGVASLPLGVQQNLVGQGDHHIAGFFIKCPVLAAKLDCYPLLLLQKLHQTIPRNRRRAIGKRLLAIGKNRNLLRDEDDLLQPDHFRVELPELFQEKGISQFEIDHVRGS